MHYPWWYVPYLTAPMLIAVIAVVHILVSHYAVGGGLFLAAEISHARRTGNRQYRDYLHGHARFFVLLTVAFGAITGVGIWWTIGLSSPLATETLIRTFVFGWATEWAFFIVEVASAFILLYYWDRLPEKTHLVIAWIYAIAAWISLVLITGITAFMLNPGLWALDPGAKTFWTAFFNPQFLPQTVARTGGALLLSSLYVYMHASLTARDARLRDLIVARAARPALLGGILLLAGGASSVCFFTDSALKTLAAASPLNILAAVTVGATAALIALTYLGPYRNPGWLSPGFAISLCLFGAAAFGAGEFVREAVRKPYIVYRTVLSNQVLPEEVPNLKKNGYLESGLWTKAFVQEHYPKAIVDGRISAAALRKLPHKDKIALGKVLFLYHCNDCHAAEIGYTPVGLLLQGRPRAAILDRVTHLDENFFMPPWCGTTAEAELLTDYLETINTPRPTGARPWMKTGGMSEDASDTSDTMQEVTP